MGWEHRGNRLYYYRKKRKGRRVVSEYMGAGLSAQGFSELDREDRREFQLARVKWKAQRVEITKRDADFEYLTRLVRSLVQATLLTSGYHPYKGQWRKKHRD